MRSGLDKAFRGLFNRINNTRRCEDVIESRKAREPMLEMQPPISLFFFFFSKEVAIERDIYPSFPKYRGTGSSGQSQGMPGYRDAQSIYLATSTELTKNVNVLRFTLIS